MEGDAEAWLARLDACDDVEELLDRGCDLSDAGRAVEAERCFRRAASLGSAAGAFNLGNELAAQRRLDEAVVAYAQALEGGETDALLNLGQVLESLGDLAGAMRMFREASKAGDSNGTLALAFSLREQGERKQAMVTAQHALEQGNQMALGVVACWRWDESLDPALEPELRAGAEHYPSARADLAGLLRSTGRFEEARATLQRGAQLGEMESWLPLGNLYADELEDPESAEVAYRSGLAAGDTNCHHNLGLLLRQRGDEAGAEQQLRLGAAAGDALAARALRELLQGQEEP